MVKAKKTLLCIVAAVAVLLAAGPYLAGMSLKFYLASFLKDAGYTFSYDQSSLSYGKISFSNPALVKATGEKPLEAETLSIAYGINPLSLSFTAAIECDLPKIQLSSLENLTERLSGKSKVPVEGTLKVHDGMLSLHNGSELLSYSGSATQQFGSSWNGKYKFTSQNGASALKIGIKDNLLTIHAENADAALAGSLLLPFFPDLSTLEYKKGALNGKLEIALEEGLPVSALGDLTLKDLLLFDKKQGNRVSFEEAKVSGSTPQHLLHIALIKGDAEIHDHKNRAELHNIKGSFVLSTHLDFHASLESFVNTSDENSYLFLRAAGDLPDLKKSSLQISLHHSQPKRSLSSLDLQAFHLTRDNAKIVLQLKNVRDREFLFAQNVLNSTYPSINPIEFSSGTVNGTFTLQFKEGMLAGVEARQLDADHLFFLVKPWEVQGGAQKIGGQFAFSIEREKGIESVEADLEIHDGEVQLTGVGSDLWHFTEIETVLAVKKGIVQKSSAGVKLGGLEGHAEILEGQELEFLRFHFVGKGSDLKPFMPERLQMGLEHSLLEDEVQLKASVSKGSFGANISGEMRTKSLKGQDSPPIAFGFSIEKLAPFLQDAAEVMDFKERFVKLAYPGVLSHLTPSALSPIAEAEKVFLLREAGFSSFTLRNGWIRVENVPLEKFVSPFLFPENEVQLSGNSSIAAHFDLTGINLYYAAEGLSLQNQAFSIEIPQILNSRPAFHRFDFISGKNFGTLPVEEGSYFDKDSGLLFAGIKAEILFEGQKVHIEELEGFSAGLFLAGNADLDYSMPGKGELIVDLSVQKMEGSFSELKTLYQHFDKTSAFLALPLEGNVSMGQQKGYLRFLIHPDDYDLKAEFECCIEDGVLNCPNRELAVKELGLAFIYDHEKRSLEINGLEGVLLIGSGDALSEFSLSAPKLRFSDLATGAGAFEVIVKDDSNTIFRVAGTSAEREGETHFAFDLKSTLFAGIHPEKLELVMKEWDRVEKFRLKFPFKLSALLHEMQRFRRSGLFFATKELIEKANSLSAASGDFLTALEFDGEEGKLKFDIRARDLQIDEYSFKTASLNGYKRDKSFLIEQLELDRISIAAELQKEDAAWKVDFLGINVGDGLFVGLQGIYNPGEPVQHAQVNLLEVDLEKMTSWMSSYPFLESFQPYGKIKGQGEIALENSDKRGISVDARMNLSFSNLAWKNFSLKDGERVGCRFRSDKGLSLQNLKTTLVKSNSKEKGIDLNLKELQYDFASQAVQLSSLNFDIDSSHLPLVAKELDAGEFSEIIAQLKKSGTLSGTVDAEGQPGSFNLQLKLKDDTYTLWDDERTLSQFTLNLEDEEIRLSTQYLLNGEYIWIATRLHPDRLDRGEIVLADTLTEGEESSPLTISWRQDPETGLVIQKAIGTLSGLTFDLAENLNRPTTEEAFRLTGAVQLDGEKAKKIAPPLQKSALETLKLGKGYALQGSFEVSKDVNASKERDVRFFGTLQGSEVELKGYRFNSLTSQVMVEPTHFQMLDLTLSDPAGTLHISNVSGKRQPDGQWNLYIPLASAYDFRPSFLREAGKPDPKTRTPLIIRQLYVQDLEGTLGNAASFRGHGNLNFDNPQKKNLQNTLFAIPTEILTRIGLNLSVLTPVNGTIHYEIQNERIYLTKFKDVYSNKKISKFYLASNVPSTIDFDGNLDVQVRFKQSTLLLKLVEMFMINVQGNLEKPVYSLQRQKYLMKEYLYSSTKDSEAHAQ